MLEFYHVNQTTQWRSYDKARQDMKIVIRELLYHSKVTVKKKNDWSTFKITCNGSIAYTVS